MPPKSAKQAVLLETGDVIKTHPREDRWGCAIVLNTGKLDIGGRMADVCLVGITDVILPHDYALADIDTAGLRIHAGKRGIRLADGTHAERDEVFIGMYLRTIPAGLQVIGRIDTASIRTPPLVFVVGNGSDGGWPLCGPIGPRLGYEAIVLRA